MTIQNLANCIEESFSSPNLLFLSPFEDRLSELLANEINKTNEYRAITQYPIKGENSKRASRVDMVCFNKTQQKWNFDEKEIWALEAKLYSPHQTFNQEKYIEKSILGPVDDYKKLVELGYNKFYILLYQYEIRHLNYQFEDNLNERYPMMTSYNIIDDVKKRNNNKNKLSELLKRCKSEFGNSNVIIETNIGNEERRPKDIYIDKDDSNCILNIHYILCEFNKTM